MNDLSPAAVAARESARDSSGQFGTQGRTSPNDIAQAADLPEASAAVKSLVVEHGGAGKVLESFGDDFSELTQSDFEKLSALADAERDGRKRAEPLMISVQPEYWDGDYAVDAGPSETFDVAPILLGLTTQERTEWLNAVRTEDGYGLEKFYEEAAARGLVTPGYGPFTVRTDMFDPETEADYWELTAPPAWTQDGITPHPIGGYVSIEERNGGLRYRDADGKNHRADGPAFDGADGSFTYFTHGVVHRADGPASCMVTPSERGATDVVLGWYIDGQYVGSQHTETEPGWSIVDGVAVQSGR